MSKKVKSLVERDLKNRIGNVEAVAVINPRGVNATLNNQIRRRLHEKKMRMTVVKNTLVARAAAGTKLKGFEKLLSGPSALVYGEGASISALARAVLDEKKSIDALEIRGAFFDGEVYEGQSGVETASKLPTREEAIANVLSALLGPGRKLAAALKGPGGKLGGILKAIEEKAPKADPAADAAPAA